MKTIGIIFLILFVHIVVKGQNLNKISSQCIDSLQNVEIKLSIINDTSRVRYLTNGFVRFWIPKKSHLYIIDSILVKAITENNEGYYDHLRPDSLNAYYKQLVCYIESNGDSLVYINALCWIPESPLTDENNKTIWKKMNWRNQIINVHDGGDCFWRININLTKKSYSNFMVNGIA